MAATRRVRLADGTELACRTYGDPGLAPMLLLHGLGEGAASWDPVVMQLSGAYRLVVPDLRGHGASSRPGRYSFELMRDDVLGLLDALGLRDVVLVGHSMGGVVAYLVALARPGAVGRLVVEDAPPPYPRERPLPERPAGELPFDWAVVPAVAGQVNDPERRWWPRLPEITAPTLLIGGGPRSSVPQGLLAEVAGLMPDCTLVTIPAGHDVHESEPGLFVETVLRWLTG